MATQPQPITAPPEFPNIRDRAGYNGKAYAWGTSMPGFALQISAVGEVTYQNALAAQNSANDASNARAGAETAAERAESSADNVSEVWSAAKDYVLGARVFVETPVEYSKYTYRRRVPGVSATPPYNDPTNWVRINGLYAELTITLAANSALNTVLTSGFYRMTTGHPDMPAGTENGQLIVSSGGNSVLQIASSTSGSMHFRSVGVSGVWTAWQRNFGDKTLIEASVGGAITEGDYLLDPALGTVHHKALQSNTTIALPAPRGAGDQVTIMVYQQGGFYFVLGANVSMGIGQTIPPLGVGEMLMLTFVPKYEGSNAWYCGVIGKFPG